MLEKGKAKRLTVYVTESDTRHGRPVFQLLVELAHQRGLGGATAVRGLLGFGRSGKLHVAHPDLGSGLPVRVEMVDSAAAIEAFLPDVYDLVEGGLVELADVEVVRAPRAAPPVPAHVKLEGRAQMLRIFIGASDRWQGRPLHEALVERLRQLDVAGATVLDGEVIVVDTAEKLAAIGPALEEMVPSGLAVKSDVEVVFYRPASAAR
jgi:PII-like signaling protein